MISKIPTIYFVCPPHTAISGGIKQIYRQASILNKNGFNAAVLIKKKANKPSWFQFQTPVLCSPYLFKKIKYASRNQKISLFQQIVLFFLKKRSTGIVSQSILVFPETYGSYITNVESQISKVIFNQNCYYSFYDSHINSSHVDSYYEHPKTLATVTVSEDSENYLRYTFPEIPLYRVRLGLDEQIFCYQQNKKRQICFMPRKLDYDLIQVLSILKTKGIGQGWNFISIEDKSEEEVASIMKESIIFLSFNHREGFGLPPVEAMACGCFVIGYKGRGGEEYFDPEFTCPINEGNIIEFVQQIKCATSLFDKNPEILLNKGKKASDFILSTYNLRNEQEDIINVWHQIIQISERSKKH